MTVRIERSSTGAALRLQTGSGSTALIHPGPGVTLAALSNPTTIRIGVLAGEPIRLEGLSAVFEEPPESGRPRLVPVVGTLPELLADNKLDYLVVDFNSSDEGMKTLEAARRARPGIRQIVIGPDGER